MVHLDTTINADKMQVLVQVFM